MFPRASPAGQPVDVDYEAAYELKPQTGQLRRGNVHIGKATADLSGNFNNSGAVASVQMKLNGQNMPASDLESVLPALGLTLPSGASLKQGTLNANLAINGPVDKLVITGPVNLSNAKLTGFDLGSKMGSLGALAGVSKVGDTDIQTFSSDMRVAPEGIRSDNLNVVVPSIGAMTGNGTISPDHKLDFKMIAHLGHQSSSAQPTWRRQRQAEAYHLKLRARPRILKSSQTWAELSGATPTALRTARFHPTARTSGKP